MIYLDTSFLAPLFREEASSKKVADFISRQAAGTLAVSKWTGVEFASLVSRDVRMGILPAAEGRHLVDEFGSVFATQLRGPDALHLAVAHNNGVEFVATLDEGMLAAAKRLKIPAKRVIR